MGVGVVGGLGLLRVVGFGGSFNGGRSFGGRSFGGRSLLVRVVGVGGRSFGGRSFGVVRLSVVYLGVVRCWLGSFVVCWGRWGWGSFNGGRSLGVGRRSLGVVRWGLG